MSTISVGRKDFEDALRSKVLWGVSGLMLLLVAGVSAIPYLLADADTPTFTDGLQFMYTPMAFLVPIIGLIVGYQAVVSERESGSIRFLLGLPNTRRDVVLGKLLGRSGVIMVPTVIAFIIGAVIIGGLYDGFAFREYFEIFLFVLIMGIVYVSIAVGVSASVSTRGKALLGVAGFYILFEVMWGLIPYAIYWLLEGGFPGLTVPAWFVFIERLSPGQALGAISITLIDFIGTGDVDLTAAGRIAGDVPFYLELWFAWIIVLLWIAVPITIGYLRFRTAVIS